MPRDNDSDPRAPFLKLHPLRELSVCCVSKSFLPLKRTELGVHLPSKHGQVITSMVSLKIQILPTRYLPSWRNFNYWATEDVQMAKGHETCATSLMIRDMKSIYLTCHVARISDCFVTHNHKPKWLKRIFYHSFGVSHTQTQLNWALLFPASLMRLQGRCWPELGSLWKSEWLGKFGFQAHRVGWSHSIPCSPLNAMPPLLAGC